ncbi:MAG: helix-turn-helix domain-containing protein [Alcanivorax jadensis]|uniref:helix-turn-helix domain-containing protein n=1 Tax=Alcanivorax jadensis TaxID=64988 RepID=UPI0030030F81
MFIFMGGYRERFEEEVDRIGGVSAIARDMGVARNTIYNWMEKGNVPLNRLAALGGVMGMDVVYVVTGQHSGSSLSAEESEMLALYRAATLSGKMAAVGALQGAASAESKGIGGNQVVVKGDGNKVAGGGYHRYGDKKK